VTSSEPRRTELSADPADYLTGPTGGETNKTHGGTTRDGAVAAFGSSQDNVDGGEVGDGKDTQQNPPAGTTTSSGQG
jgi:hypothetical protein